MGRSAILWDARRTSVLSDLRARGFHVERADLRKDHRAVRVMLTPLLYLFLFLQLCLALEFLLQ